jgi:uncharacterized protein YkwD
MSSATATSTRTSVSTATSTSTSEASATSTDESGGGGGGDEAACLSAPEAQFLQLINNYRASLGLGQLKVSRALNIASYKHSEDMGDRNYFDHNTPYPLPPGQSGPLPWDRMADEGYNYNTYKAENIAAGYTTAQQVFDGWKASPGHDANMRNPNLKVIGIGLAVVPGSGYVYYWTTDFGGVVDAAPGC